MSSFLRSWGWLLLLAIAAGVGALLMALRNEPFRERFDAGWLNLPLIGRLSRGYNAARFAGTLAMLAGAGVPILKALQAAAETLSNRAMRADAMDALVQVREGAPLASALAGKKRFPGILAMFSRLGEQTGQLPTMLERAAKQLSAEVQRRAMQMATILEPLLIVGMGGVVMLIVLAVLLADHPAQQLREVAAACDGHTYDAALCPHRLKVSSSSRSRRGRCSTSRRRTATSRPTTTGPTCSCSSSASTRRPSREWRSRWCKSSSPSTTRRRSGSRS